MLPTLKRILWMMLLASGLQTSWAFSLLGPVAVGDDAWQVEAIGYNPIPANSGAPPFFIDLLAVGPKNLGEEYRRNSPVMFYTCDASFLDYFGSNGSAAVDQAFAILNDVGRTNISAYSKNLSEFSLNTVVVNYQAQALGLRDLKSQTLALMTEQLGLTDSVRYVWALHNRFQLAGTTCPNGTVYQVIMRNFDFMASPLNQLQYSPYINGSLFSYFIYEICGAPAAPPNADALDFTVDPLVNNPPVASLNEDGLQLGYFFTGLTRDDVAGLRYLISSNNFNTETLSAGSTQIAGGGGTITNNADAFALTTSNLTDLVFALTNNPTALQALYPGLVIAAVRTNFNGTFTYTFANLVTNTFFNTTTIQIQVQAVVTNPPPVGSPFGSGTVSTNATTTTLTTNLPSGDFFLIPTNLCGLNVIGVLATNVIATTNSVGTPGTFPFTNVIIFSTNHVLLVAPCEFIISGGGTNANTGLFQGMEKFQFVRANFDSLLSQFFQPVTNFYQTVVVINNQALVQSWQRVVTTPDLLFSAADILPGPAAQNSLVEPFTRTLGFDQANALPGLAGPGVITNSSTITYNKVGPVFLNIGAASLTLPSAIKGFIWGSFDETTNDPVVYPNGTSIENLANQVLIQISPSSLADGTNGVAYPPATFTATGGQFTPPYTWSAPAGLPAGLALSSNGTISGQPAQSGRFDFIIKLTDSLGRSVTWSYSITIH